MRLFLRSGIEFEMDRPKLVVTVFSFSYMKGVPADESGNGGGFVFDCRAIHNPGKYEQYKKVSGLEASVIDFWERDGEILDLLKNTTALLDFHVARFIERGFTHLSVAFGCTGGQHRSVYAAQKTAEHLSRKFGVEVHLTHREQGITTMFSSKG